MNDDSQTTTASATPERQTVTTITRAIDVLQLFIDADRGELGVTEISKGLGLSKAVVHRILTTLTDRDLVTMDPSTRRYQLGPMTLALGVAYLGGLDVRTMARPRLRQLSDATNETATLSIRHGWQRIYVDQALPDRDIKMSITIGEAFPLHAGSSSKTFLAYLGQRERDEYLDHQRLTALTEHTPTDPDALRTELATIRERGYAVSFGERQLGAGSIAAPVLNHLEQVVAVISICGPVERFRDAADGYVDLLLATTGDLSRLYGYRGPSVSNGDARGS